MAQREICLTHDTPTSAGKEHARPKTFVNEMTSEDVEELSGYIIELTDSGMKTADLHKALQHKSGKRLGDGGKSKVGSERGRYTYGNHPSSPTGVVSTPPHAHTTFPACHRSFVDAPSGNGAFFLAGE